MNVAYFDCFSGISGDMVLGALVDAGCRLEEIEAALRCVKISDWYFSAEKVMRHGLAATHVLVDYAETHHHRSLTTILQLIDEAKLPPRVTARAAKIFRRLAESEARVHNVATEEVHFHEVGAVDAIIDIVGACIGLELLGIGEFSCSALNVGAGRVSTQHGILPVPAPATADLLRGTLTYSTGVLRELVTPTGAAIVASLASDFGSQPPMIVRTIGYGAGTADLAEQPNVLRLTIGEKISEEAGDSFDETIVVLEANLDDMNPQIYGYFAQCAFNAGALDVFSTPVQMKKNRPGLSITVICKPAAAEELAEVIFRETTTLGVRKSIVRRQILQREIVDVETSLGTVRVKVGHMNGRVLNTSPEYEDCKLIAETRGVPLKDVLTEAAAQFQKSGGVAKINAG
jgi:uncharacterized protein (TIGR00299 family) protein